MTVDLKTYTDDEIIMLLSGDRREVDKLILHSINNLSAALIPRIGVISELGDLSEIRNRMLWIDEQIERQRVKNAMMRKVVESATIWAVIILFGFIAMSSLNEIVSVLRTKIMIAK